MNPIQMDPNVLPFKTQLGPMLEPDGQPKPVNLKSRPNKSNPN